VTPVLAALISFGCYFLFYKFYARYIATRVFALSNKARTPAHELRDDVDYAPCHRTVLFGHHYASITGLAPMLGPAVAVIWGWLPALLWVVGGSLLIGGVHDFSALVVSIRARGMSIGKVAEGIMGRRAKSLFHVIIFFLVSLAMGVFVYVVALLFTDAFHPEAIVPSGMLMLIAATMGFLIYKKGLGIGKVTTVGFLIMLASVAWGINLRIVGPTVSEWSILLLIYAFLASVLPVWLLLQPRDYINSLLLYLGLGAMYLGFFILRPTFVAPAVALHPAGAPPLFPFVFIIIACGAVSGFHALVSSGTTAKQLNRETDARPIGYGAMIGESLLGLMAVLACTAGFANAESWGVHYASWQSSMGLGTKISAFISGSAHFISTLGVPQNISQAFVSVIVVSFALTTLDSATRLLRYNISEIGETLRLPVLGNRYAASILAVSSIAFFAFFKLDGRAAGLALWELFGTTNQLLAGLALLVVSLYLLQRKRPAWITIIPMIFVLTVTLIAMATKLKHFWAAQNPGLFILGGILFILGIWLLFEAALSLARLKREGYTSNMNIVFEKK
jgi:carbon starvation protein